MANSLIPSVSISNAKAITTSKAIADFFNKQHKHVLEKIESLIADCGDWGLPNFRHTPYIDPQNGQTYPAYEITRDGFTLLAMGFTGKQALKWKIAYIEAFNAMEAKHLAPAAPSLPAPAITPAQQNALQNAVAALCGNDAKKRVATWSRFNNHFKLGSYKQLPSDKIDEALAYLEALAGKVDGVVSKPDPNVPAELTKMVLVPQYHVDRLVTYAAHARLFWANLHPAISGMIGYELRGTLFDMNECTKAAIHHMESLVSPESRTRLELIRERERRVFEAKVLGLGLAV